MASIGTANGNGRQMLRLPLRLLGDDRLARMAARGDGRAFEAVYRRYHRELYRYCRAILGESEEANDALQSTMAVALDHLPNAERRRSLRGWLYRVAHNEAVSILRRRTVPLDPLRLPEGIAPGADVSVEQRERLRQLVSDLRALPDRQRGALLMREMSDLSYPQIAEAMATSPGAARQLVYEAREALRAADQGRRAAIARRRADLTALFPPLAPAGASGLLASLLGGIGEGGTAGTGGATAIGGAGVKAASIASVVVLGAGAAGIGGGLESPFGPGGDPAPAASVPRTAPVPSTPLRTSEPGGKLVGASPRVEHTAPAAQDRSDSERNPSHRHSGGDPATAQSRGRAVRDHGGAAGNSQPVGPPATPPGAGSSSSATPPPSSASGGNSPSAADQGLTQAVTAQTGTHTNSSVVAAPPAVPGTQAGANAVPRAEARTKP